VDDYYWKKNAAELLEFIGGDESYQMRVLTCTLLSIRATLRGSRFEAIGDRELRTTIGIAIMTIRGGRCLVKS
jgi:hypothetical protein